MTGVHCRTPFPRFPHPGAASLGRGPGSVGSEAGRCAVLTSSLDPPGPSLSFIRLPTWASGPVRPSSRVARAGGLLLRLRGLGLGATAGLPWLSRPHCTLVSPVCLISVVLAKHLGHPWFLGFSHASVTTCRSGVSPLPLPFPTLLAQPPAALALLQETPHRSVGFHLRSPRVPQHSSQRERFRMLECECQMKAFLCPRALVGPIYSQSQCPYCSLQDTPI